MKKIRNIFSVLLVSFCFNSINAALTTDEIKNREEKKEKILHQLKDASKALQTKFVLSGGMTTDAIVESNGKTVVKLAEIKGIKREVKRLKVRKENFKGASSTHISKLNIILKEVLVVKKEKTAVDARSNLIDQNYSLLAQINTWDTIPLAYQPCGKLKIVGGTLVGAGVTAAAIYASIKTIQDPKKREACLDALRKIKDGAKIGKDQSVFFAGYIMEAAPAVYSGVKEGLVVVGNTASCVAKGSAALGVGTYNHVIVPVWDNVIKPERVRNFVLAGVGGGTSAWWLRGRWDKLKKKFIKSEENKNGNNIIVNVNK